MIYVEVVRANKIEKRLRESLNKVGYLLKVEKWTTKSKEMIIKELEDKIVSLSSKPDDGSQFKSLIEKKTMKLQI